MGLKHSRGLSTIEPKLCVGRAVVDYWLGREHRWGDCGGKLKFEGHGAIGA